MYIEKVKRFILLILCALSLFQCNSINKKENPKEIWELGESEDEFILVKYTLYRHKTKKS